MLMLRCWVSNWIYVSLCLINSLCWDYNLGVVNVQIIFKVVRLNDIIQGIGLDREKVLNFKVFMKMFER